MLLKVNSKLIKSFRLIKFKIIIANNIKLVKKKKFN